MTKILVLHGKGMETRGKVDIEIFGTMTLPEYDEHIRSYAKETGVDVEIFHSNEESEVVDKLKQASSNGTDAALINPSGYTTGYPNLLEAIKGAPFPTYEIHISNPANRGRVSEVAGVCKGVITGFAITGYRLGLLGAKESLRD